MQAYKEENFMGIWVTGKRVEGSWAHPNEDSTYYELAAYVQNILSRIGMKQGLMVQKKSENPNFSAGIVIENRGGKKLIEMGILSKKLLKQFDLQQPVYFAELNWTQLMKATKKNEVTFSEISKAGVIGLTRSWAKEFAMKGGNVRVNAVAPGYTMTNMMKTVPENLLEKFRGQTMLGRLAEPEEIAGAVLFLASDLASYVTGEVLNVNGGMRL